MTGSGEAVHQLLELLIPGHKVCLTVHLNQSNKTRFIDQITGLSKLSKISMVIKLLPFNMSLYQSTSNYFGIIVVHLYSKNMYSIKHTRFFEFFLIIR